MKQITGDWNDIDEVGKVPYILRLFVAGASSNSMRAIANLKSICEAHLFGQYELTIIDVHQDGLTAKQEQIIALPMLIRTQPLPERRLIGDMSDSSKVLRGLGITP